MECEHLERVCSKDLMSALPTVNGPFNGYSSERWARPDMVRSGNSINGEAGEGSARAATEAPVVVCGAQTIALHAHAVFADFPRRACVGHAGSTVAIGRRVALAEAEGPPAGGASATRVRRVEVAPRDAP